MYGQKNLRNVKIGFLIFVGVLVAVALFHLIKNDNVDHVDEKTKDNNTEIITDDEQNDVDDEELKRIEEKYKESPKEVVEESKDVKENKKRDEKKTDDKHSEDEDWYKSIDEEFDFEGEIKERVGEKEEYDKLISRAEKAFNLFVKGSKKGWNDIGTESLINDINSNEVELLDIKGDFKIDIYPIEQQHKQDIFIGAMVDHEKKVESYTIILKKVKGKYLVDEFVLMWSS